EKDRDVNVRVTATDLTSDRYSSTLAIEVGEAQPIGLAEALWRATNILHFDGQIVLVEQDVTGVLSMGKRLNLTGGRPEWETMRALVQSVTEDATLGTTTIVIGAPQLLGRDDIMALLRMTRNRMRYTTATTRATGASSGGGSVELGKAMPRGHVNDGGGELQQVVVRSPANGQIRLDPSLFPAASISAGPMQPREFDVCVNGEEWQCVFLASALYKKPENPTS
ncbi:MAG: hypothetical protein SFY81_14230, partial [Verrucomicrobiota bacterium]|nr:hypothetical protein [Verrucomicrobiota bacterium]